MTREEAASTKEEGARSIESALYDPEHAEAIRDESHDDRIARKTIHSVDNPRSVSPHIIEKGFFMPTKEQLQKRVRELEVENDALQDQLDQIFDIVAPADADGGDGNKEDKDDESGED
jgi:hypothetical protein